MSRWFWVRHGPTHARGMVGWTDLPADLSDTDRLKRLEAWLPSDALVISSDLGRASATADAIAGTRPRLPDDRALREMNFGSWEMKTWQEVSASDPDLSRAFWSDPGDHAPPGGESWNEAAARVAACVDRIAAANPGRDVIAVAHMGVILMQVARAVGLPPHAVLKHRIDNLSVTEIHVSDAGWQVAQINHDP